MRYVHELKRVDMLRKASSRAADREMAALERGDAGRADKYGDAFDTLWCKSKTVERSIREFIHFYPVGHQRAAQRNQLWLAERYTGIRL